MAKHTLKIMAVNTAKFLENVRPFLNIMHEKVNRSVQDQLVKRHFLSLWKNIYGGIQLLATLHGELHFLCSEKLLRYILIRVSDKRSTSRYLPVQKQQ